MTEIEKNVRHKGSHRCHGTAYLTRVSIGSVCAWLVLSRYIIASGSIKPARNEKRQSEKPVALLLSHGTHNRMCVCVCLRNSRITTATWNQDIVDLVYVFVSCYRLETIKPSTRKWRTAFARTTAAEMNSVRRVCDSVVTWVILAQQNQELEQQLLRVREMRWRWTVKIILTSNRLINSYNTANKALQMFSNASR